jgi:hypothetical protein
METLDLLDKLIIQSINMCKTSNTLINQQVYINLIQAKGWLLLNIPINNTINTLNINQPINTQSTAYESTGYDEVFKRSKKYPNTPIKDVIESDPMYVDWMVSSKYIKISPDNIAKLKENLKNIQKNPVTATANIWVTDSNTDNTPLKDNDQTDDLPF